MLLYVMHNVYVCMYACVLVSSCMYLCIRAGVHVLFVFLLLLLLIMTSTVLMSNVYCNKFEIPL